MEIISYLLQKGADPMLEDTFGSTPVSEAKSKGYTEVKNFLEEWQNLNREEG